MGGGLEKLWGERRRLVFTALCKTSNRPVWRVDVSAVAGQVTFHTLSPPLHRRLRPSCICAPPSLLSFIMSGCSKPAGQLI